MRSRTTGLSAGLRYMAGSSCRPTATMSRAVSAGWRCKGRPLSRLFDPSSPTCAKRSGRRGHRVGKLLARNAAMGKVVDHGLRGHGDVVPKAARLDIRDCIPQGSNHIAPCPRWPRHEDLRAEASAAYEGRRRGRGSRAWSRRSQQRTSTPDRCPARPQPARAPPKSRVGRWALGTSVRPEVRRSVSPELKRWAIRSSASRTCQSRQRFAMAQRSENPYGLEAHHS